MEEWTEREIAIAKQLSDAETIAFIRRVFVDIHTSKEEVLKTNIASIDDAEYGRLMKVVFLAREQNKERINLIKMISKKKTGEASAPKQLAPR